MNARAVIFFTDCEQFSPALLDNMPWPLLPVAGTVLAEHMIRALAAENIRRITLVCDDHADVLEAVLGTGERWGVELDVTIQRQWAGPADGVARLPVGQPGQETWPLVVFAHPMLGELPLQDALKLVGENADQCVFFEDASREADERTIEAVVCTPLSLRRSSEARHVCDMPPLAEKEEWKTDVLPTRTPMRDAHTLREYWKAKRLAMEGKLPFLFSVGREQEPGIFLAAGSRVYPEAELIAPVRIGSDSLVEAGAVVGPHAAVGAGCIISENATISHSQVLDGTFVGPGMNLEEVMVWENLMISLPQGSTLAVPEDFLLGPAEGRKSPADAIFNRLMGMVGMVAFSPLLVPMRLAGRITQKEFLMPMAQSLIPGSPFQKDTAHRGTTGIAFLDALPGLLEVAKGRMHIIGPALLPPDTEKNLQEWHAPRFSVPPGLIPPWICMVRSTLHAPGPEELRIIENQYAATKSLASDLRLLSRSLLHLLPRTVRKRFLFSNADNGPRRLP